MKTVKGYSCHLLAYSREENPYLSSMVSAYILHLRAHCIKASVDFSNSMGGEAVGQCPPHRVPQLLLDNLSRCGRLETS